MAFKSVIVNLQVKLRRFETREELRRDAAVRPASIDISGSRT
jgi:hypothetical protein